MKPRRKRTPLGKARHERGIACKGLWQIARAEILVNQGIFSSEAAQLRDMARETLVEMKATTWEMFARKPAE